MYGLAKLANDFLFGEEPLLSDFNMRAWERERERQYYQRKSGLPGENKETVLTPQERESLEKKLRDEYGVKAHFKTNYDGNDHFRAGAEFRLLKKLEELTGSEPYSMQDIQAQKLNLPTGQDYTKGIISSENVKEVLLHEAGHSIDFKPVKISSRLLGSIAPLAALGTGVAVPMHLNKKQEEPNAATNVAVGGAVGAGVGIASALPKHVEMGREEDRANTFVKRFLTDELGDVKKADEAFANSSLPHYRDTYRKHRNKKVRQAGIAGLVGAGVGAGISAGVNHFNKESSDAVYGLAKVAADYNKKLEALKKRRTGQTEIQHGYDRDGVHYGVSISKDDKGYYAHTHRARSKSYESIDKIPVSKLKFIDGTG